jgi:hypothetical protein
MRHPLRSLWLVALVLAQLGCGDDGPNQGFTYADLEGTWTLSSLVIASDANAATTVDLLAAGWSGSINFLPDTTYLLTFTTGPGSPSQSATGPVTVEGKTVSLTDNDDPDAPNLVGTVVGQRLTLVAENAEYDFDGDGTDDPAQASVVFVR